MRGKQITIYGETTKSARDDWRTPIEIIELVRKIYGGTIDTDPCASDDPKHWFANENYDRKHNGLTRHWIGKVYINNPYGKNTLDWIRVGNAEYAAARAMREIWLVPARLDTKWWRELMKFCSAFAIKNGRVRFEGADAGAMFPSALVYLGIDRADFVHALDQQKWTLYEPFIRARLP